MVTTRYKRPCFKSWCHKLRRAFWRGLALVVCRVWRFLFIFQLCLAFSFHFSQADIFSIKPGPGQMKWSTGVFPVLHSPQEPLGDNMGSSSRINGTEQLQRCQKTQVKVDLPFVPYLQTRSNFKKSINKYNVRYSIHISRQQGRALLNLWDW